MIAIAVGGRIAAAERWENDRTMEDGAQTAAQGAEPPLVEAKLAAPVVRREAVDRPRLRQALDAGATRSADARRRARPGSARRRPCAPGARACDAALAWVTLDAGDNDPVRLWSYVATAVDRVRPGLGRSALRRLAVPGSPVEDAVDELMNGIAALGSELVVVLDDLHTVTSAECLSSLDHAIAHLPADAHLVAVTRADPALRLASYRASGRLVEVRASELAFTRDEARELLVGRGHLELGPEELDVLVERTEGWPAALVLAGLWLRTVDDPARAVRAFGGEHRFVAEYLSTEVLVSLDPDRRSFLHGARGAGRAHRGALRRRARAHRLGGRAGSSSSAPTSSSRVWAREAGSASTRCSPSTRRPSSPRRSQPRPTRIHRRAAVWLRVARAADRGGPARGRGR